MNSIAIESRMPWVDQLYVVQVFRLKWLEIHLTASSICRHTARSDVFRLNFLCAYVCWMCDICTTTTSRTQWKAKKRRKRKNFFNFIESPKPCWQKLIVLNRTPNTKKNLTYFFLVVVVVVHLLICYIASEIHACRQTVLCIDLEKKTKIIRVYSVHCYFRYIYFFFWVCACVCIQRQIVRLIKKNWV